MEINTSVKIKSRFNFIDWAKYLGMYFIVLGHMNCPGNKIIYTFSVPLFFILSGVLEKSEPKIIAIKKILQNYCIPLFLIVFLRHLMTVIHFLLIGRFSLSNEIEWCSGLLLGLTNTYGEMWFVFTLMIIKIIRILTIGKYTIRTFLLFFLPLIGYLIKNNILYFDVDFEIYSNAYLDVCLSYPYYVFGAYLGKYKKCFNDFENKKIIYMLLSIFIIITIICGLVNGNVRMFNNGFGNNIFLFYIGGIIGSLAIIILCWFLRNLYVNSVVIVSMGNILILGFHMILIKIVRSYFPISFFDFLLGFIILTIFIPIVLFVKKYIPILIGVSRLK